MRLGIVGSWGYRRHIPNPARLGDLSPVLRRIFPGTVAKSISQSGGKIEKGWPMVGSTCHPAPIIRSVDLTRLGGQCVLGANPGLRPQPIPPCKDQAVSVSGTGRPPPGVQRAAVSRGQAPSIAVSTRFSSRELPCWEHRDAPVVTTLRGTSSVASR